MTDDDDGKEKMLNKTPKLDRKRIELMPGTQVATCIEVEDAILERDVPVYVSAGQLVIAIEADTVGEEGGEYIPVRNVRLVAVTMGRMIHLMEEACIFFKYDNRRRDWVMTDAPESIARLILSRIGHWPFPEVTNIVPAQTLESNGDIVDEPGVHRPSRLLLADLPALPAIKSEPDKGEAIGAINVLHELLEEYQFVGEESRSVALSMLITPVCRGILPTAPLHAVTAPTPGSGKSYLSTLASLIATGRPCPVIPPAEKGEEFEKRLTAVMMAGMPIISLDNVVNRINSPLLCQALTEPVVDVRPLGTSSLTRIEQRVTWFANGNHLQVMADLTRRTILATVDRNEEKPEEHEYRGRPDRHILVDRGRYVAAALTVVSSYLKAKRPARLPPLASYERWSKTVREALCWLGYEDPCVSMTSLRANDEERNKAEAVFMNWPTELDGGFIQDTAAHLITSDTGIWQEVVKQVASNVKGDLDARQFGYWLKRWKDRVLLRRKLVGKPDRNGIMRWTLQTLE